MILVLHHEWNARTCPHEAPRPADIEHNVVIHLDAPRLEEKGVGGGRDRVRHQQHTPSRLEEVGHELHLLVERGGPGPGDDQDPGVRGDPPLGGKVQGCHLVPLLLERFPGLGITRLPGVGGVLLPVPLDEVDLLGFAAPELDDGVGQVLLLDFLVSLLDLFPAVAVGEDEGSELELGPGHGIPEGAVHADVVLLGDVGPAVRVDEFIVDAPVGGSVLDQQVTQRGVVPPGEEGLDVDVPLEMLQDLQGLWGQAELPVSGGVEAFYVPLADEVQTGGDGDHQQEGHDVVGGVFTGAFAQRGHDLPVVGADADSEQGRPGDGEPQVSLPPRIGDRIPDDGRDQQHEAQYVELLQSFFH